MAWTDAARAASLAARRAHMKARRPVYHVTLTKHVPSIRKRGLLPGPLARVPSNWVQAGSKKRYGAGEIYGFAKLRDAVRWAGRMDWELHKGAAGKGKISIVKVRDRSGWRRDRSDPLSQAGRAGAWVKRYRPVLPKAVSRGYPVTSRMIRHVVNPSRR